MPIRNIEVGNWELRVYLVDPEVRVVSQDELIIPLPSEQSYRQDTVQIKETSP